MPAASTAHGRLQIEKHVFLAYYDYQPKKQGVKKGTP
jgi:hypothetical protein